MLVLVDDSHVRVSVVPSDSAQVTLCFTGVGHAMGGVDVQGEEFTRASSSSTAIFVIDKQRTWGNSLDFPAIVAAVAPYIDGKEINALGNSMGGFLAILASRFVDLASVVAFVPQFSVSKAIVPSEHRWDQYVDKISSWRYESLAGCFLQRTSYYILAGYNAVEAKQLDLFPSAPNIHKIYFRGGRFNHNVAQELKAAGLLYPVIGDCFEGKSSTDVVAERLARSNFGAYAAA